MANTIKLEIVTPEGSAFSDDVEMVNLPGADGELGIFPQHAPLVTQVVAGEVVARKAGKDLFLAIGDGFAEITAGRVAVMTDMAVQASDIDEAKAEEARRRAEQRMKEKISAEEMASVNSALMHSLAQIKVKRRHRN